MQAREMSSQEQDALAGDVMESLGEPQEAAADVNQSHESAGAADNSEDHAKALASAKKRLKAQGIQHERELREMHARMADLQTKLSPQPSYGHDASYGAGVQPGSVDEQIHKAVSFALNHREMEERKAKEVANQAHVQKQYKDLYKHLDSMGDKYDDFHDVVFGDDTQYTPAMRDYAMTLPKSGQGSAGEVLYKLGKSPQELERIARLHPLDQAAEMTKLSHALISGGDGKSAQQTRTLGNIKTTPVSQSHVITDKTPVSSLRQRMKSGQWK
jgi:hypothetical protein